MLRPIRRADSAQLAELVARGFPEDNALLRWRPGAVEAILGQVLRPDVRFLLWFLERIRYPVVKVIALEADGRLAGVALVSFPPRAGYISSVVVDEAYRRRGYATRIVRAAEATARRAGKSFVVLDVLRSNGPARALYAQMGYRLLHELTYRVRDQDGPAPPAPAPVDAVRPFVSRDATTLVAAATRVVPPGVAEVLPPGHRQFHHIPRVAAGLRSETASWVVDRGAGAEGFVRATQSAATEAGHLTAPIFALGVPDETARAAIRVALDWLAARSIRRVVCEMPTYNSAGLAALTGEGFREAYPVERLYHPLA